MQRARDSQIFASVGGQIAKVINPVIEVRKLGDRGMGFQPISWHRLEADATVISAETPTKRDATIAGPRVG